MKPVKTDWADHQRAVARKLEDAIVDIRLRVAAEGYDVDRAEAISASLTRNIRAKIERLFEEDWPLARLMDGSDFTVKAEGDAAKPGHYRAATVSSLIDNARTQTKRIASALAALGEHDDGAPVELAVSGFAPGSIIVGFVLESIDDQIEMPMTRTIEKEVLNVLSNAKRVVDHDELGGVFADAFVRDVAMQAIAGTAPKPRSKLDRVSVRVGDTEPVELTQADRVRVSARMNDPKKKPIKRSTFEGVVRELDLDAGRFHVRQTGSEVGEVRCLLSPDGPARATTALLNSKVRVSGPVEIAARGRRALMWVDAIDIIGRDETPSDE